MSNPKKLGYSMTYEPQPQRWVIMEEWGGPNSWVHVAYCEDARTAGAVFADLVFYQDRDRVTDLWAHGVEWTDQPAYRKAGASRARKRTKFQTCERHRWLDQEARYRRAEFFLEGGPTDGPCQGGKCRLWPGTDLIAEDLCHDEYRLDWGVNEAVPA